METGRCEYKQQKKLSPIIGNSFNTILHLHAMLRFQVFSSNLSEKNSLSFFLKAELPTAYDEGLGMSVLQIKGFYFLWISYMTEVTCYQTI